MPSSFFLNYTAKSEYDGIRKTVFSFKLSSSLCKDSDESKYIVREVAEILLWYRTELIIRICLAIVWKCAGFFPYPWLLTFLLKRNEASVPASFFLGISNKFQTRECMWAYSPTSAERQLLWCFYCVNPKAGVQLWCQGKIWFPLTLCFKEFTGASEKCLWLTVE